MTAHVFILAALALRSTWLSLVPSDPVLVVRALCAFTPPGCSVVSLAGLRIGAISIPSLPTIVVSSTRFPVSSALFLFHSRARAISFG